VVVVASYHVPRNNERWLRVSAFIGPIESRILYIFDTVEIEIIANTNNKFTVVFLYNLKVNNTTARYQSQIYFRSIIMHCERINAAS